MSSALQSFFTSGMLPSADFTFIIIDDNAHAHETSIAEAPKPTPIRIVESLPRLSCKQKRRESRRRRRNQKAPCSTLRADRDEPRQQSPVMSLKTTNNDLVTVEQPQDSCTCRWSSCPPAAATIMVAPRRPKRRSSQTMSF